MIKAKKRDYLLVFIIIFTTVTPLVSNAVSAFLLLAVTLLLLLDQKIVLKRPNDKIIILFFFAFMTLLMDILIFPFYGTFNFYTLFVPIALFFGYLMSQKYDEKTFYTIFERLVFVIALFSLVSVVIYTFYPSLVNQMFTYHNKHTTHKTMYVFNVLLTVGDVPLKRNAGIAWEPGVFQLLLNIALYFVVKKEKKTKRDNFAIVIYIVTILTTISTVGYLLLFLNMLYLFRDNKKFLLYALLAGLLFSALMFDLLYKAIINKAFGTASFTMRLIPLLNGLEASLKYPLGLGNIRYNDYFTAIIPPWDSIGAMAARFSLFFLFTYLLNMTALLKNHKMLVAILLLTLATQTLWDSALVLTIIFLAMKEKDEPLLVNSFAAPFDITNAPPKELSV